jgi:hypothetical protein
MLTGQMKVGVQTERKQTDMVWRFSISRTKRFCGATVMIIAGLISGALAQQELPSLADEFAKAAQPAKHSCQIIVQRNGTMVQNVGATKLSSQVNAGLPGLAEVTTTNGSYEVSIDAPVGFSSSPKGGNVDVVFEASYSGHGKTNFANTPGNVRVRMKNGVTQLDVHLEATKLSGAFHVGNYESELTLRCE